MGTLVISIIFLAAIVVLTIIFLVAKDKIKEWHFRRHARPVITAMVMANNGLFDPKSPYKLFPGTVVFGFYDPSPKLCTALRTIAHRAYALYAAKDLAEMSPGCRQFAKIIKDHYYTEDRRYRVPEELCGSLEIFAADLHIHKDHFSKTFAEDRMIACAVTGNSNGKIVHLPPSDSDARKLYAGIR
jgi:hypothetical protein